MGGERTAHRGEWLPLSFWSELGDLPVLVKRDDGVGVYLGAIMEVVGESGIAQ
jgi:hypothetical protein